MIPPVFQSSSLSADEMPDSYLAVVSKTSSQCHFLSLDDLQLLSLVRLPSHRNRRIVSLPGSRVAITSAESLSYYDFSHLSNPSLLHARPYPSFSLGFAGYGLLSIHSSWLDSRSLVFFDERNAIRCWDPDEETLVGDVDGPLLCPRQTRSMCYTRDWNHTIYFAGSAPNSIYELSCQHSFESRNAFPNSPPYGADVWGLAAHPRRNVLLSVSSDRTLRLWDRRTASTVGAAHLRQVSRATRGGSSIALDPSAHYASDLVFVGLKSLPLIAIFDIRNLTNVSPVIQTLDPHNAQVRDGHKDVRSIISLGTDRFVSVAQNGSVGLWHGKQSKIISSISKFGGGNMYGICVVSELPEDILRGEEWESRLLREEMERVDFSFSFWGRENFGFGFVWLKGLGLGFGEGELGYVQELRIWKSFLV